MAELDDDAITVTLPAEDGGAVITKVEEAGKTQQVAADDPISDLKGQFETLKGQLGQQTQRLVGAERELESTRQELASTKKEVATSQLDTVLSGIQAAEAEATAAEGEFIKAAEAGDFAAQARAQRKISGAEARIQRLKEAEGDLKDQAATKPAPRQEVRQQPSNDPLATFTQNMAPRARAWIYAHPDCVTNKDRNDLMMKAHHRALADGIEEGGDEYFERIEAGIKPVAKTQQQPEQKPVNIRPSAPVASGANAGGGMNGGGQSVTLSVREKNAAEDGSICWNHDDKGGKFKKGDPIGVQEFARRKAIMTREGHYNKNYTDS